MTKKLGQYFTINEIIYPVIRDLKVNPYILGFKIQVAGRLTRAERASFTVHSYQSVPLSTATSNIDFALDFTNLRFGMVAIKMWLHKKSSAKTHYYYFSYLF